MSEAKRPLSLKKMIISWSIFILFFGGLLFLRKNLFYFRFIRRDYILVTILGLSYTVFSEYINVFVHQSWTYSSLMPVLPFIYLGVIPLIQWSILPAFILYFVKNNLNYGGK